MGDRRGPVGGSSAGDEAGAGKESCCLPRTDVKQSIQGWCMACCGERVASVSARNDYVPDTEDEPDV